MAALGCHDAADDAIHAPELKSLPVGGVEAQKVGPPNLLNPLPKCAQSPEVLAEGMGELERFHP